MNSPRSPGSSPEPKRSSGPIRFLRDAVASASNHLIDRVLDHLSRVGLDEDTPCAVDFREGKVFWGMRNLPDLTAANHFMVCGTTGSGKTTIIQLFLQSIAPRFHPGRKHPEQLIIADSKCDIIPLLGALGIEPQDPNVWILNPYDKRCASWNLGEAAQTPLMARQLASLLIPKQKNTTAPYFPDAARRLAFAVIQGLNACMGSRWSLRDLICALDSLEHIQGVAAKHPRAHRIATSILSDDKHAAGVVSTVATCLGEFEDVAALWHSNPSGRKLSIPQFLANPGVLVLGNDPALKESLWPINAMLLKALTHEILRGPNLPGPRRWFVLDEFPAMEKVECITDLLSRGRSKGASVVLGFHSLPGMIQIYQEHGAEAILSLCSTKTFLRLGDPQTAEWAQKCVGTVRYVETSHSQTFSKTGDTSSVSESVVDRPQLLASSFMDIPFPEPGGPFTLVSDIPAHKGLFIMTLPASDVFKGCRKGDERIHPSVIPRINAIDQTLKPWTPEEERLYCVPLAEDPPPTKDQKATTAADSSPSKTKKPKVAKNQPAGRMPKATPGPSQTPQPLPGTQPQKKGESPP